MEEAMERRKKKKKLDTHLISLIAPVSWAAAALSQLTLPRVVATITTFSEKIK